VPDFLAPKAPGQGLAGSAADRLTSAGSAEAEEAARLASRTAPRPDLPSAGPDPALADLVRASSSAPAGDGTPDRRVDAGLAAEREAERAAEASDYARAIAPRSGGGRKVSSTRPAPRHATEDGPLWERARRTEAYPQIKAPGLPAIPRVGLVAIALFGAAALLFFIGPDLFGIGGRTEDPTASPTPSAGVTSPSPALGTPTPIPEPTPQIHVVQSGDTLSRIARSAGVTVEQILEANPQITDPNRIAIGDEIIIPTPKPTAPATVEGSASPAPSTQ
jgi:LysM repeat protein